MADNFSDKSKQPKEDGFYNTNVGVQHFDGGVWLTPVEQSGWEPSQNDDVVFWEDIPPLRANGENPKRYTNEDVTRFCDSAKKRGMQLAWEDMLCRFGVRLKYRIADLFAHKYTVCAIELQGKSLGEACRIESDNDEALPAFFDRQAKIKAIAMKKQQEEFNKNK